MKGLLIISTILILGTLLTLPYSIGRRRDRLNQRPREPIIKEGYRGRGRLSWPEKGRFVQSLPKNPSNGSEKMKMEEKMSGIRSTKDFVRKFKLDPTKMINKMKNMMRKQKQQQLLLGASRQRGSFSRENIGILNKGTSDGTLVIDKGIDDNNDIRVMSSDDPNDYSDATINKTIQTSMKSGMTADEANAAVLESNTAEIDYCSVRDATLDITPQKGWIAFPPCIKVKRCQGCTATDSLKCGPYEVAERRTMYYAWPEGINPEDATDQVQLRTFTYYDHLRCKEVCKIQPENCNSRQVYNRQTCRCDCKNKAEQNSCPTHKRWDFDLCRCICHQRTCPAGQQIDEDTCLCVLLRSSGTPSFMSPGLRMPEDSKGAAPTPEADSERRVALPVDGLCERTICPKGSEAIQKGTVCECVMQQVCAFTVCPKGTKGRPNGKYCECQILDPCFDKKCKYGQYPTRSGNTCRCVKRNPCESVISKGISGTYVKQKQCVCEVYDVCKVTICPPGSIKMPEKNRCRCVIPNPCNFVKCSKGTVGNPLKSGKCECLSMDDNLENIFGSIDTIY